MDGTTHQILADSAGLSDLLSTKTHDSHEHGAVAQLIILDRHQAQCTGDKLRIRGVRFDHYRVIDGYPLVTDSRSDFHGFKAQYTIRAHTATLIAPDLVLTTGHGVVERDLRKTYFLFGRHKDAAFEPRGDADPITWFEVEQFSPTGVTQWARAGALRAWQNPRYDRNTRTWSGADWAIVELEQPVSGIAPIDLAPDGHPAPTSANQIQIVSHPLGLPRKRIEAKPLAPRPSRDPALLTDFGSGASGSPVLVDGKVWAVVAGSARFQRHDIKPYGQGRAVVIEPRSDVDAVAQPITIVDSIRGALRLP